LTHQIDETGEKRSLINGVSLLKAITTVFALVWYLQPIQIDYQIPKNLSEKVVGYIIHMVNSQILCLAVPTLIILSLYSFFCHIKKLDYWASQRYLFSKSIRLFLLYLFYLLIQTSLLFAIPRFFPNLEIPVLTLPIPSDQPRSQVALLLRTFWAGGPRLPIANDSILYVLLDLSLLTVGVFLYDRIHRVRQSTEKGLSISIIATTFFLFEVSPFLSHKIDAHQLENFIIYIPIAGMLAYHRDKLLSQKYLYLMGYLLFAIHDFILEKYAMRGEMYSRTSMVLGSLALISFSCSYFSRNPFYLHPIIKFISTYSLAIFLIHKYVMIGIVSGIEQLTKLVNCRLGWDNTLLIGEIRFRLVIFILSIVTIILTILFVKIMEKSKWNVITM